MLGCRSGYVRQRANFRHSFLDSSFSEAAVAINRPASFDRAASLALPLHRASEQRVAIAALEPLRLRCGIDQRREYLRRGGRITPFDAERRVHHRARRTATRSATLSASGSIRQVRTRPTSTERTSPEASSTARCCMTAAGSDICSGRASLLTEPGPRANSARIARARGHDADVFTGIGGSPPARGWRKEFPRYPDLPTQGYSIGDDLGGTHFIA